MYKLFAINNNNKIELTKEELEKVLNESFWSGYNYKQNNKDYYIYTSPCIITSSLNESSSNIITTNGKIISNGEISCKKG